MSSAPHMLFSSQASDGPSGLIDWRGGEGTFAVWGAFGAATCKLQVSFDAGSNWIDVENTALTAAAAKNFRLPVCMLRADLSGAGGGTSVSARV